MEIILSNYGTNLGSRILGREIINSLKNELIISDSVIVDFNGIELVTLSFCTEMFDTISNYISINNIQTINKSKLVNSIVNFSFNHIKPKEFCI